jgi:KDO2-lipid IV(A) lauroyltransferase
MRAGRQRLYEGVIERSDLKRAFASLKQGRTLWYAADQDYGLKHSVFAPLFGVPAATIMIPARLARVNDSPVVFYSHFRDPVTRRWSLRLSAPLEGYPSGDALADATRINHLIEAEIRTHPDQYLWLHRRFKTRPPGVAHPYRAQPHRHRRGRRPSDAR